MVKTLLQCCVWIRLVITISLITWLHCSFDWYCRFYCKLQLDQGLGIGSKFPIFNRHQLTMTRFIQLKEVEEGAGKPPPPVLVLHGHYGGCVGDLPSYDAFTLGGPYSVRGYNMGEIGAARNILEVHTPFFFPVIVYRFILTCAVKISSFIESQWTWLINIFPFGLVLAVVKWDD